MRTNLSAILPSIRRRTPFRPRVPITTRSAPYPSTRCRRHEATSSERLSSPVTETSPVTPLSLWIPQYLKAEYGMSLVVASAFTAGFSLPGSVLRAVGGVLADRFGAHSVTWWGLWVAWICLFLLSYPSTDFVIHTITAP